MFSGSTFKFNTNGSYDAELGDISNNEEVEGTWEFASNETKIIFDKGTDDEETYDIVTLSSSTLTYGNDEFSVTYSK